MKSFAASLAIIVILFTLIRFNGLDVPYHQDEYKGVIAADAGLSEAGALFHHPPLIALLFRADALIFGEDHMRLLPLLFGIGSAVLLGLIVRKRFDARTALCSVGIYTVSFYGVWSSLMVDVDGAVLPLFFLATVYAYDRYMESKDKRFLILFGGSLLLGFLTKLSFVLVLGAVLIDFFIAKRKTLTINDIRRVGLVGVLLAIAVSLALGLITVLYPGFTWSGMIHHASSYMTFSNRGWTQTAVQLMKALFYLSPLLLAPLLLVKGELVRARIFTIYLVVGLLFYLVIFDFSQGALDKYFMFSILPLSVLSGAVLARLTSGMSRKAIAIGIMLGTGLSILLLSLVFLAPKAIPLYPKSAWLMSIIKGDMNILTPFTGGSGPAGFYVSFLFIFMSFLVSLVLVLIARFSTRCKAYAAVALIVVGITYNGVFIEEFAYGALHGNAPSALEKTLQKVEALEIPSVITYNDLGAYELTRMNAYAGRFYAAPQFEESHVTRFSEHVATGGGHFMVVGIPALYEGFYTDFFKTCDVLYEEKTGVVVSAIYSCKE